MENKPRFYFGLPERRECTIDENIPYTASKDIKAFEASGAAEAGLSDTDFFYYEIESDEQYFIGNEINFKNKNLIVTEVHGFMDRGLFRYKYKLSRKAGLYCEEIKNKALSGAAFDGKILAVQGQTVRMHLSIDSEQVTTKAHWFPFAPPTGNMMYCMPKVGTSARLYFPNSDPENAEVTGSVRANGGSCTKTGNPNNRYLGTEHGSELAMLPDEMSISGSKKNLFMSMKNDTGLDFTSHKKIVLNAAEGVYFKTPKKVIINGENSILVTKAKQKKGFSLEGEFNFLGANSKIEAKDRTTYPDFNDEPKNDTKAKAAAIAKKKAEAEKKSGFSWGKLALFAVAAVAVVAVAVVAPVAATVVGAALIGAALGVKALASSGKLKSLEQKAKNEVKEIKGLLCGALIGPFSAIEKKVEKSKKGIGAELEKFWNSLYTDNPIPEYSDEELRKRYPGEYARLMSSKADNERIIKASPVWTRMIPYLGEGIAGYELVNGKDVFTGDKLTTGDKVVDGISLATGGISRVAGKGGAVKAAEIGDGAGKAVLSSEEAEEIAFDAIKGPNNAEEVVLGKYDGGAETAYTNVAKNMDAQYFQLDNWDELASKYSDDEIWKINQKFLDIETSSGREIYLSHNPEDYIGDGTFYSKEIQYLIDNGYKFVNEGDIWHAIR